MGLRVTNSIAQRESTSLSSRETGLLFPKAGFKMAYRMGTRSGPIVKLRAKPLYKGRNLIGANADKQDLEASPLYAHSVRNVN